MQTDWASENLQVIRTLMERGAVYRRALAPVTGCVGATGVIAAGVAGGMKLESPARFIGFWLAMAAMGLAEAFLLVRRQAVKDHEPLWSPPTRRVAQAVTPAFLAGGGLAIMAMGMAADTGEGVVWLIIAAWMILYGCGVHAAGFFAPRGVRLFGWGYVIAGLAVGASEMLGRLPSAAAPNVIMGVAFGGGHCAYSVYLYFTEQRRDAP